MAVRPPLGKEGDKNTYSGLGMRTRQRSGVICVANDPIAQDNAGKTTLLYRLKVRLPYRLDVL